MTVDTQVDLAVCDKCGSQMTVRQVKASTGEFVTILQCTVCRHYITSEDN